MLIEVINELAVTDPSSLSLLDGVATAVQGGGLAVLISVWREFRREHQARLLQMARVEATLDTHTKTLERFEKLLDDQGQQLGEVAELCEELGEQFTELKSNHDSLRGNVDRLGAKTQH